jgi:Na+/pantothenate symporter
MRDRFDNNQRAGNMDVAIIAVSLVVIALSVALPIFIIRTARSGTYDSLYFLIPLALGIYWLDYQAYDFLASMAHGFRN